MSNVFFPVLLAFSKIRNVGPEDNFSACMLYKFSIIIVHSNFYT